MDEPPEAAALLPFPRTCPFGVPPGYGRLRAERAVSRAGLPGERVTWLVTRLAEARAVLADPRFSADRSHPSFPLPQPRPAPPPGAPPRSVRRRGASLIGMDPPEHTAARKAVISEFTARRVQAMRPRIQQIVDQRVTAVLAAGPPADLVAALAFPVPSEVVCELLGVPYSDHEFFQSRSAAMLGHRVPPPERRTAFIELFGYLDSLVSAKEAGPGADLLGRQIARRRAASGYDHGDLVSLAFLLLVAGHETTANMISLGVLAILRGDPPGLAAAVRDPAQAPGAVEELLRYFSIADIGTGRVAVAGAEIGGTLIREGDAVIVSLLAANHDPGPFPGPEVIDPGRDTRQHVAFGAGPHQCLGQSLARAELEIAYATLLRRIPGLRLAVPPGEVPVKDDAFVFGLRELPVTW